MPYKDKIQCVYGIFSENKDCVYIGSTNHFHNRKRQHIGVCVNKKSHNYTNPLYVYIRENGGFGNFHFKILEIVQDQSELRQKERSFIKMYKPLANAYDVCVDARHSTKWQTANTLASRHRYYDKYLATQRRLAHRRCINPLTNKESTYSAVRAYYYRRNMAICAKDLKFLDKE